MPDSSVSRSQGSRPHPLGPILAALSFVWSLPLSGQIFRYQDEQGGWHFTDQPPQGYEFSVVPDIPTSATRSRNAQPTDDLEARLASAYNPISPIAYATLAVVSIETDLAQGSGFFCSERGHILTTKHLIRPGTSKGFDEAGQTVLNGREELAAVENQDRKLHMGRRAHTLRSEVKKSKRERVVKTSFAATKRRFDIILKDGTRLAASLVKTSASQDLALLKLDGYRTPFLGLDSSQPPSRGVRVFAIGNPLEMQNAVTSGVVTQITPEYLLTDAQVLPGSSGGPLLRENGEVIGINVSRKVAARASKYSAGFGKAIPIELAVRAFAGMLSPSRAQSPATLSSRLRDVDRTGDFATHGIESSDAGGSGFFDPEIVGFSSSAPVGQNLPRKDGDSDDLGEPAQPVSRSLDFPPEGSGIFPEAVSFPPD
jgi:serine protease Do